MIKKILIPLDFSDHTDEIVSYGVQLARRFQAEVHLLHVIPNLDYFTPYESFLAAESLVSVQKDIETEVTKDLQAVAQKIEGVPVKQAIHSGVAFLEIIDYVRTEGIDLIVMGTHGRGGIEHILIGSVAEKVVRKSPCPVLTIRPAGKQFSMP
jgi:universal stress protein A